jgi:tyrosine-protein kinase Etk/Wzc
MSTMQVVATTGIVDINVNQQALTQTVESARSRRSQLLGELYGSQAEAEALNNQLSLVDKKIVVGSLKITDPVIDGMRGNLSYAKNELLTAKASFLDDSTIVKQAAGKVKAAEIALNIALKSKTAVDGSDSTGMNPIYQELKSRASIASSRSKGLQKQLAPIEAEIKDLENRMMLVPNMESKYYELLRKRLISEDDYQTNAKLVNMLTSVADNSGSQILSLADPSVISEPVAPEVRKVVILSIIIGSLLGLAYSFMVESFRLPVHTSWQLAELTSLPVAASVPYLPKSLVRRHALSLRENSFKPIESFRFMAFSMISRENKPKVVLFTAVGEEVDSATAAAEFAISMSKTGSKTTLVDFDLRVPRLSDLFEVQSKSGVSDILARTTLPGESIDLIQPTQHENLQILPAGSASSSGLADFVTSHLNALIDDLKSKSDILVVNCPPVDVFADASRLAQYVDEVCLVISAKTTSYRAIPVAQEILNKSGAKSVSLILTHASQTDEPFGNRKMSV